MSKFLAWLLSGSLIGAFALLSVLLPGPAHVAARIVEGIVEGTSPTPTPVRVLFRDDFLTRANRWRAFDLGKKSAVSYTADGLLLRGSPAHYAIWTVPDNALRLSRFEIETEARVSAGDAMARVGVIIDYRSESDLLVLAISRDGPDSRDGKVYFGNYLFGIWKDILPPLHASLNPGQPVVMGARVDAAHNLRFTVNGQPTVQTRIGDFTAGSFGLFALTGKSGGVQVVFHRFIVDDIP